MNSVAQQAIEFWSTICDVEADIYLNVQEGNVSHHWYILLKRILILLLGGRK